MQIGIWVLENSDEFARMVICKLFNAVHELINSDLKGFPSKVFQKSIQFDVTYIV